MKKHTRTFLAFALGGCFLFVDQVLKYVAFHHPEYTKYIIDPWLGWEYFENPGIAFSLPFPNALLLILTPIIVLGLAMLFVKTSKEAKLSFQLGVALVIGGAISNFADRVLHAFTIDYLRILTSIINIADIMIVAGAILLATSFPHKNASAEEHRPLTPEVE